MPRRSIDMFAKNHAGPGPSVTSESREDEHRRGPAPSAVPGIPAIEIAPSRGFYLRAGKRVLDLLVAGSLLLLLSPLFVVVAILIKADSRGPVFYRCKRVGLGGRPFTFLKFRSMVPGAQEHKAHLLHMNEVDGPVFKLASDPRTTRVGRLLRRTSIDELPQLVHVLTGEMSLVGPRPPEPEEVLDYEAWQLRRLSVRPGLTCLWQISGRSLIGFDEWMRLDLAYIDGRSFGLDVRILLKTFPAVASGRGAY
jgi:lipopolysaccharide/colanic/teichoic acid biosynthesis glycosyltransferase